MVTIKNPEFSSESLRQRAEELLKSRVHETKLHISESEALKRLHELEVTQIELELQNDELLQAKCKYEETNKLIHKLEIQQIELELQNEELILARQAAEDSTQKYAELYDFAPTAYLSISKEGEIIELNLTAAILLGKERTKLIKSKFGCFVTDETKPTFNQFLNKLFNGSQKETCELTISTTDALPIHVHLVARISEKGDHCLLNITNITVSKQTEEALNRSEQMLQNILEHFPGNVYWKDRQANFLGCNKSFAQSIGLKNQMDIASKDEVDLDCIQFEAENLRADDLEVMNTGIPKLHIEKMKRRPDGSVAWMDTNKVPLRDAQGQIVGLLGVVTDISERKLAQDALKQSEQMLQYVLDNFPGVVFWKDTEFKYLGCNQTYANSAGLNNPSDIKSKTDFDLAWSETDAKRYRENDIQLLKDGVEMLHIVESKDTNSNKLEWFDTTLVRINNSQGENIGLLGVSIDITGRKQAEKELLQLNNLLEERVKERTNELLQSNICLHNAEEKFRTVADFTNGWEYWIDNDGKLLYMSPSAYAVTGYKSQEFFDDPELLNSIVYPSDKQLWANHKKLWKNKSLSSKQKELNFRILTKNGEERWIGHISRNVLKNGKYQGLRVSNRNITERIKAENELLKVTIEVEERERNRFSSELHDSMGPLLSTIKLYFQWLAETDDEEKLKFIVEKGNHNIEVAIQTSREISRGLSSMFLKRMGYVGALSDFVQGINDTKKLEILFSYNRNDRFTIFLETTLFRITTELIKNTLSYANATKAEIGFYYSIERQIIFFTYTDNGIGFDIEDIAKTKKGIGLLSIQQRIQSVSGKIKFKSKNGTGMKVTIILRVDNGSY